MAMSVTALSAGAGSTTNSNNYVCNAGTPATGDTLLAIFHCMSFTGTVTSFSGGGTSVRWSPLYTFNTNNNADRIFIYTAYYGVTPAAQMICGPTLSGNAAGVNISVFRITGLEGDAVPYVRQVATNNNTTTNPTAAFSVAPLTGNGIIGIAVNLTNSATQWTAPSGFTQLDQTSFNTPACSMQTSYSLSGITGTSHTWTNSNTTRWNTHLLEFYVSGTGATIDHSLMGFYGGISSI